MGKFGCIICVCVCVLVLIRSIFPHPKDQKDEGVCLYVYRSEADLDSELWRGGRL
jgi:hypothetical protein